MGSSSADGASDRRESPTRFSTRSMAVPGRGGVAAPSHTAARYHPAADVVRNSSRARAVHAHSTLRTHEQHSNIRVCVVAYHKTNNTCTKQIMSIYTIYIILVIFIINK